MSCQEWGSPLNIGPSAKPSAGSVKAPAATAPAVWAVPVMNRRRVIVSPSKAPGILRSAVYLDLCFACLSDTEREQYRGWIERDSYVPRALVRIASSASGAPAKARRLARLWAALDPQATARAPAAQTASARARLPSP